MFRGLLGFGRSWIALANVGRIYLILFLVSFPFTTPRLPLPPESIWNAASFYQESSYLYFPTLQAEPASDISFYFKSSAPSGVFLENLGLKDFIRLELTCESTLAPDCSTSLCRNKLRAVRGVFIICAPLRKHWLWCR